MRLYFYELLTYSRLSRIDAQAKLMTMLTGDLLCYHLCLATGVSRVPQPSGFRGSNGWFQEHHHERFLSSGVNSNIASLLLKTILREKCPRLSFS